MEQTELTERERQIVAWLRINRRALQFIADDLATAIERGEPWGEKQ